MYRRYLPLIAALPLAALAGCDAQFLQDLLGSIEAKPTIEAIRPRIARLDFKGVDLAFDVDVKNPYGVPLKSPVFEYGLLIDGADFMKSTAGTKVDLPANKIGTLTLPMRVGYLDLWKSVQSMKDKPEVPYTFQGALVVPVAGKTFKLPLKKSGAFPVLRIPKIAVRGIETANVSLGSAKLKINAALTNPNIFALNAGDLGYNLKLGELSLAGIKLDTPKGVAPGQTESLALTAEITGLQAVRQLLKGAKLGGASLKPTGAIKTEKYGTIKLPD